MLTSMPIVRSVLFCAAILCAALSGALPASGQTTPAQPEWVAALRAGGHVIVFRHGATHQDQADTDPLNLKNVAQQRQLNDSGRALARTIGDAFRKLQIPGGQVVTSMFQRAVETGTLMRLGEVTQLVDISEGGLVVTPTENNRRMAAMRKLAATPPPAGTNVVLVSHKPNIMDAFGKDWFDIREGEASVFKPDGSGGYKLLVRVQAGEWSKLAGLSAN
jgi:phosphohistidine phosphatase SixA